MRAYDAFGNEGNNLGFEIETSNIYDFNKAADRTEARSKGFYRTGKDAVALANRTFNSPLSPEEELLIKHEGFTTVPYLDTENIPTIGIGQTGDYFDPIDIESGFRQAVADKQKTATTQFGDAYTNAGADQKAALLSLVYRGDTKNRDTGKDYQWVGKYKKAVSTGKSSDMNAAFNEFWNSNEYNNLLTNNSGSGVLTRIKENSLALFGKTK